MQAILDNWPLLIDGLIVTIQLSIQVILFGTIIGLVGGISLLYGGVLLRTVFRVYVDIIRGLPLLVTIFLIYYGGPAALSFLGVDIAPFTAAVVALSFFAGGHMSEIIRGAIGSVPTGQTDAAKSIGLTFFPRLRHVILPQSLRRIVPPWVNLCVELIKGTSLVALVSVTDLMLSAQQILERTAQPIPFYVLTGLIYFVMCYSLANLAGRLEKRFSYYD